MALLEVSNLGIAFGGLQAVSQLDLKIEKGHLYGLIGPNGAGKTTVFNMLTGVYKPTEGNIVLDGNDITGATPEAISKAGIARTFQNIRLFSNLTVEFWITSRSACTTRLFTACGPASCACRLSVRKSTRWTAVL